MGKPVMTSLDKADIGYEEIQTIREKRRLHRLGRLLRAPDISERLADCKAWLVRGLAALVLRKGR